MTEEEALGKLAYEQWQLSHYGKIWQAWKDQPEHWKQDWIASAKAVADHVLQQLQMAVEASE